MNIFQFVALYLISLPVFIGLDLLWLGVLAKGFYQTRLGHLLGDVNWLAAVIFYLVFLLGLLFFATYPAVVRGAFLSAVLLGGLYGLCTYATYDLTNWATLRDWPVAVVLVDVIWGSLLGATVSGATYFFYTRMFS